MEKESGVKNNDIVMIPFAAYEASETRWTRRLTALIILIAFMIAAFVTAYIIKDKQWRDLFAEYDYTSSEVTIDGKDGIANYVSGQNNEVNNDGKNNSEETHAQKEGR